MRHLQFLKMNTLLPLLRLNPPPLLLFCQVTLNPYYHDLDQSFLNDPKFLFLL